MGRALAVLAAVVTVVVVAVVGARAAGLGPLASAPVSRLYVAISRTADENSAREIEVVDVATGERLGFDIGTRVAAVALAPDRRTLFAGGLDGRVAVLDASRGSLLRTLEPHRPILQLLALAGERVVVVTGGSTVGITVWDAARGRELVTRELPSAATGRVALAGDQLVLPVIEADSGATAVLRFDLTSLESRRTAIAPGRGLLGRPAAVVRGDGRVAVLTGFDARTNSARLAVDADDRALDLVLSSSGAPPSNVRQVRVDLASAADGALHACVSDGLAAVRYVVAAPYTRAERVGTECGWFGRAGDGLFLGLRGRPQVLALDPAGRITRTLLLPGVAVSLGS